MSRISPALLLCGALALCPLTGIAALPSLASPKAVAGKPNTFLVDDSATVVLDGTPAMEWRSILPSARDHAIIGRTRVNVRLRTEPWVGKTGRVYMALPATSTTAAVTIQWRTQGRLQEGSLSPGGRALLYAGPIRDVRLEDVLDVQIEADGTRVTAPQQLRFHFEIDVE